MYLYVHFKVRLWRWLTTLSPRPRRRQMLTSCVSQRHRAHLRWSDGAMERWCVRACVRVPSRMCPNYVIRCTHSVSVQCPPVSAIPQMHTARITCNHSHARRYVRTCMLARSMCMCTCKVDPMDGITRPRTAPGRWRWRWQWRYRECCVVIKTHREAETYFVTVYVRESVRGTDCMYGYRPNVCACYHMHVRIHSVYPYRGNQPCTCTVVKCVQLYRYCTRIHPRIYLHVHVYNHNV